MKIDFTYAERKIIIEGLAELPIKVALEMHELFKSTMLDDKEYTFNLTLEEVNIVLPGLGELKASKSFFLISKINEVVIAQQEAKHVVDSSLPESAIERADNTSQLPEGDLGQIIEATREDAR